MKMLAFTAISMFALSPAVAFSEEAPPAATEKASSSPSLSSPSRPWPPWGAPTKKKASATQPVFIPAGKLNFKPVQSKELFKAKAGVAAQQSKVKQGAEYQYNNKEQGAEDQHGKVKHEAK